MFMSDVLTLDAPRRTADGYLAVRAKAARTGVYQYAGHEVDPDNKYGLRDQASVNVLRDDADVFDKRSVHSFIGKPITNDHPTEAVTASNWKDHAGGVVMGAIRDGDHLAFDLMLTDADAIAKVDAGKRELSNGYSCDLVHGDFVASDGVRCAFKQTNIRGNHVAIVDKGRAGPACAIRDAATCESVPLSSLSDSVEGATTWLKKAIALHKKHMDGTAPTTGAAGEKSQMLMMTQMEKALAELEPGSGGKTMKMDHFNDGVLPVKTMLIDGLTVDIANADTAQATITTILAARDAANTKVSGLETQVAALTTDKATLEAKVTTLEQAVKDAKPTPAQLRDAGKALMLSAGKAKALGVAVTDEMDEGQIMATTVNAKMGDSAKGWNADQIAASFAVLTKDAKVDDANTVTPIGSPMIIGDSAAGLSAARKAWLAGKQTAHLNTAA
ncbi:DUF2213 domain-containing protein [Sphingomonas sp. 1P08PE]|uniref:DUF2213 domain-containing protein n=1 Tax=Sphingomonas sp. 1P08PE TaxID=554122 RepID=UPI0039A229A4